jgi:hypothetical protein
MENTQIPDLIIKALAFYTPLLILFLKMYDKGFKNIKGEIIGIIVYLMIIIFIWGYYMGRKA